MRRKTGQDHCRLPGAGNRFVRALVAWYRRHGRDLPWRRTRDPYAILVSEVMLQQTQVATVIGYYERWLDRFPDVAALARADGQDVLHAWQGLGYYSRARNLHRTARHVAQKHGGKFPRTPDALAELPGIGPYTAGAVASFAFNHPAPLVDANVARVLARLTNFRRPTDSTEGKAHLWNLAARLVPRRTAREYNNALMELGALVCLPRKPQCPECPVRRFCRAPDPESLPLKKPRRSTELASDPSLFIRRNGRILLERESAASWHGLWRLPKAADVPSIEPLASLQYPIMHFRVRLDAYSAPPPRRPAGRQRWIPLGDLPSIPMPSPHRRMLNMLLDPNPLEQTTG